MYAQFGHDVASLLRIAAVAAATLALGCEPSGPAPPTEQFPPDPDLPAAVVDLPSPPPESAFEIREYNDDGTLRVEGAISNRDNYLEEEIEVRGTVSEVVGAHCNPSAPHVDSCPRLHLLIRDHVDDDQDLMVVGFDDSLLRTAGIREGRDYVFEGVYTDMAHDFVSTEEGLIDLKAVDGHEVR